MWKDSYLVGVELIDNQHKELFRISRNLLVSLKQAANVADYKSSIIETIAFLKDYIKQHFVAEEGYLSDIGYKDLVHHKQLHVALNQEVLHYEKLLVESEFSLPAIRQFLGFLNVWLIQHVGGEDQKYADSHVQKVVGTDIASKIIEVIKMMTGNTIHDVGISQGNSLPLGSNLCFRVGLVGQTDKAVGFAFSSRFASDIFKAMTGMEFTEQDDLIVSAMSEISNIMAGHIAPIASGTAFMDIETPKLTASPAFPAQREITYLSTSIGDMAVLVFDKTGA